MSEEGGSNGGAGGDDLSGLSGFFFYVFIVHPATAWILRPGRFEKKKSILYAIGFLALLAAVKTGMFNILILRFILVKFNGHFPVLPFLTGSRVITTSFM